MADLLAGRAFRASASRTTAWLLVYMGVTMPTKSELEVQIVKLEENIKRLEKMYLLHRALLWDLLLSKPPSALSMCVSETGALFTFKLYRIEDDSGGIVLIEETTPDGELTDFEVIQMDVLMVERNRYTYPWSYRDALTRLDQERHRLWKEG
jgi:hypothetical protein